MSSGTDFRAELQRLVKAYDDHGGRWPQHHEDALQEAVERARAKLAVEQGEGPPSELIKRLLLLSEKAVDEALTLDYGDPEDRYVWRELQELRPLAKAALEGAEPVTGIPVTPGGPTEDEMNDLADDLLGIVLPEGSGARLITRALELWGRPALAQPEPEGRPWPVPGDAEGLAEVFWGNYDQFVEPEACPAVKLVPVSERPWEREGWCDREGRCALFSQSVLPEVSTWVLAPAAWASKFPHIYSHALPHHALPVPKTDGSTG